MKKLVLLLCLITFQVFSQDQECILYFKDGTSIEGFGTLEVKGFLDPVDKIKFRLTKDEEGEFWGFEEVSKITFIGFERTKTFEYVKVSKLDKPELLELLVDGNVKLYKNGAYYLFSQNNTDRNGSYQQQEQFRHYLKRETEEYPTCIDCYVLKSWVKSVSNYFSDCETLVTKLKNHKYTFAEIESVVEYYNDICAE